MASFAKVIAFGGFKCRVASFRVEGAALNVTFQHVSWRVELHFAWQAQCLCVVFRRWVAVFVAGKLHRYFALQVQHFRRAVLPVFGESHCQGCVRWWQRAKYVPGRRGMLWHAMTLHTLHLILYTLPFTLRTLDFTLYTPHFTLHTSHSTMPTSHSTHYVPHATLHFLHTPHFALHPLPRSTVYSALVR